MESEVKTRIEYWFTLESDGRDISLSKTFFQSALPDKTSIVFLHDVEFSIVCILHNVIEDLISIHLDNYEYQTFEEADYQAKIWEKDGFERE